MRFYLLVALFTYSFAWEYYSHGKKITLIPLNTRNIGDTLCFLSPNNQKICVKDSFLFLPKSKECEEKILTKYNLTYTKVGEVIKVQASNPKEAFDLANKIYESGCAIFSHPDIALPIKKRFDTLFNPQQWNFYNYGQYYSVPDIDLNIYEAWLYTKGEGVKVGIIDDGFDVLHPDLQEAFVDTYNAIDGSKDVMSDEYNYHGTLCAGLVGARENGFGVIGAAPKSSLVGIKLINTTQSGSAPIYVSDILKAFSYASSCDVISCSWGTYDVADAVRYAIDTLSTQGRDGKGIPIVFANGNDGMPMYYWQNDESALESVISIGAVTNLGEHPWYSNYGPALDFVAPSGGGTVAIATTDARGSIGLATGYYGHPDYTWATDLTGFNGTSAAAPQVAGVIALMLSRNADLTKEQIVDILKKSSKKVGDIPYYNGRNDYFGYGLVDAEAAVKEAVRLKVVKEILDKSFDINGYFIKYGPNRFDWIYIAASLKYAAKLEGMDSEGYLKWRKLDFKDIVLNGDNVVIILNNKDPLYSLLSQKSLEIDGYFVHYDKGAYEWVYIPKGFDIVYKLEGLDYKDNFLWIDIFVSYHKVGEKITFIAQSL